MTYPNYQITEEGIILLKSQLPKEIGYLEENTETN